MKHIKRYIGESKDGSILYGIASEIADKLRCNRVGNCVHFAELFVLEVGRRAPELLDTFHVVEGWVGWELGDGQLQQHTWIELEGGEKLDPTFVQFTKPFEDSESTYWAEYSGRKRARRFSGREYYEDTVGGTWFGERRELFPEMVFKSIK
jgi:hypothetical protein